MTKLLTIKEAADLMNVSRRHVQNLITEAKVMPKKAKWKQNREFVDLTPMGSKYQTIRINPEALGLRVTPPPILETQQELVQP